SARHDDRYCSSRFLRRRCRRRSRGDNQINLKTNQIRRKLWQALIPLLCKPVLDDVIPPLNPSKLAHLFPERIDEDRVTGRGAWIQVTDAEDFSRLLRVGHSPTQSVKARARARSPTHFGFWIADFGLST